MKTLLVLLLLCPVVLAQSETPSKFEPTNHGFNYERRIVEIPMRDGVKLHTVILVPKGARRAPILLTRTPYDATGLTSHAPSAHLASVLQGYDNAVEVIVEGGYIRVVQDVRGKYVSEGDYVMNRPLRGPLNPTPVDHATDTLSAGCGLTSAIKGRKPLYEMPRMPTLPFVSGTFLTSQSMVSKVSVA